MISCPLNAVLNCFRHGLDRGGFPQKIDLASELSTFLLVEVKFPDPQNSRGFLQSASAESSAPLLRRTTYDDFPRAFEKSTSILSNSSRAPEIDLASVKRKSLCDLIYMQTRYRTRLLRTPSRLLKAFHASAALKSVATLAGDQAGRQKNSILRFKTLESPDHQCGIHNPTEGFIDYPTQSHQHFFIFHPPEISITL